MNAVPGGRDAVSTFGSSLHELAAGGLAVAGAGNVGERLEDGSVRITRAGLCLGQAEPEDVSYLSIDGIMLSGGRPSSEVRLHTSVYLSTNLRAEVFWRAAQIGSPHVLDDSQLDAVVEHSEALTYSAPR